MSINCKIFQYPNFSALMNILFQELLRGKKDLLHCLGWMGYWEEGCIQVHSWGRTLDWWRQVERGWNSVHSAPVVEMIALELESPFFLASGVEKPEYLEGEITTLILKPKWIYMNIMMTKQLLKVKMSACHQKTETYLCFSNPEDDVAQGRHKWWMEPLCIWNTSRSQKEHWG